MILSPFQECFIGNDTIKHVVNSSGGGTGLAAAVSSIVDTIYRVVVLIIVVGPAAVDVESSISIKVFMF